MNTRVDALDYKCLSKTVEENEKEKDKIDKAKLIKRVKIITMMRERMGLWTKKEGSEEKEKTMVKTKNRGKKTGK